MQLFLVLIRLALLLLATSNLARAAPADFNLPASTAPSALTAFAKQAGVEVLFSFEALKDVRTNAVVGRFEPADALARLLRGSGFVATLTAPGKFVIVRQERSNVAVVRGTLLARATGVPVADAVVRAVGSGVATRSDGAGAFVLPTVSAETLAFIVQKEGFVTLRVSDVQLTPGRTHDLGDLRLRAAEGPETLDEVVVKLEDLGRDAMPMLALQRMVVTPSRFGLDQERGTLAGTLTETELQALPQLGEDLYRAITRLPGLAADDYSARFWVRGAPHEQVLARLDGVELVEPFHMKDTDSSLAIVDLESINRLDLYTGGFAADYGDRLGGVLLMETDTHVRAKPRTTLGLSMTGARVGSRGQLANGRGRWLVGARSGYPDIALEDTEDGTRLKMRYYDITAKWEMSLAPTQTVSFHALHSGDTGRYTDPFGLALESRYESDYFWARWKAGFGERLVGETVLSHSAHSWWREGKGVLNRLFPAEVRDDRALTLWTLRSDWTLGGWDRLLLRGGVEAENGEAEYDYRSARDVPLLRDGVGVSERRSFAARVSPDGQATGAHVSVRMQPWERVTVEPGVRYDANTWADDATASPRLSAAWEFGATTARFAWGLYHQAQGLHQLGVLDRDLVFREAEQAEHLVLSFEHRLASRINLRLEGYERIVTRVRPHWGNVISNVAAFPELADDRVRFDPRRQESRGVELTAERRIGGKFSWSASYAYAQAEETLRTGRTIPRPRDQRHTFYADVAYTPNPRWQFSATWRAHTGWPTTEETWSLVTLASGQRIVFGQPGVAYAIRLPTYQRMDLRAQRRFQLRRGLLRVYVDVFNAFDRANAIEYDYRHHISDGQLSSRRVIGDEQVDRLFAAGLAWDF